MKYFWSVLTAVCGVVLFIGSNSSASRIAFAATGGNQGKEIYEKRCTGCHALDNEKTGPHLRDVYGRPAARLSTFPYSKALRQSGLVWDGNSLDKWLTDPDRFVPDNDMAFRVPNPEERAAIIGYLKQLSGK